MSVRREAVGALRDAIAGGRWRPGDRLPGERDIAAALGVSRGAAREALRELATQGLIEGRRGSGTYVASVDPTELAEVRLVVEPLAARLAAERHSAPEADALEGMLARLAVTVEDPEAFAAADVELHAGVIRASGNSVLERMYEQLTALLVLSRGVTAREPGRLERSLVQHEELVAAILAHDGRRAESAMRRHIRSVGRTIATRQREHRIFE
jgi:GntR family transcriptional repressor for pyruvate dehydrogenase complex